MGDHLSLWDFARRPVEEVRNCSARAGQRPLLRAVVPFMQKTCRSAKGRIYAFAEPSDNARFLRTAVELIGKLCGNVRVDSDLTSAEQNRNGSHGQPGLPRPLTTSAISGSCARLSIGCARYADLARVLATSSCGWPMASRASALRAARTPPCTDRGCWRTAPSGSRLASAAGRSAWRRWGKRVVAQRYRLITIWF